MKAGASESPTTWQEQNHKSSRGLHTRAIVGRMCLLPLALDVDSGKGVHESKKERQMDTPSITDMVEYEGWKKYNHNAFYKSTSTT